MGGEKKLRKQWLFNSKFTHFGCVFTHIHGFRCSPCQGVNKWCTIFRQCLFRHPALSSAFKTRPEVLNKSLIVPLTCRKPFKPLKPITADCLEQDSRSDDSEEFERTRYCLSVPARTGRLAGVLSVRVFGCYLTALGRRFVGLMCRGNLSFLSFSDCGKNHLGSRELWKEKEGTAWVTERERIRETFRPQVRYDSLWLSMKENTMGCTVMGK